MPIWNAIVTAINSVTAGVFSLSSQEAIRGGCINEAWKLSGVMQTGDSIVPCHYFVKLNDKQRSSMFTAESEALLQIAATKTVSVPQPIVSGVTAEQCWLVLEYIELTTAVSAVQLGRQLADMHRHTADSFGWHRNNTIGSTVQINKKTNSWIEFWREQRLGYQLQLAAQQGYGGQLQQLGQCLMSKLDIFFDQYNPSASLLHGDLWGGNWSGTSNGNPVIFDPATYYGDRETDIAMTELFGGFPPDFYAAYTEQWPLQSNYPIRKKLYNLYHILNHLNLFGESYSAQAESMMKSLLAEI
ncbi:Ribulosamine/erythrulosamine 3-kinase potentially involved in protein deglycation [hydrothermal vent metagenome]|uniref:Ribulosamine/erythrulosamine 3-kinase potentially involved in protein deglycation n=1 Tax=hydrothermal vent metagenome TaxID=652676 RepID=A0A3B0ZJG8_9ZZZZ